MQQFLLPPSWDGKPSWDGEPSRDGSSVCILGKKHTHRLLHVLRLKTGNSFPAIDASGKTYICTIMETEADSIKLAVSPDNNSFCQYIPDIRSSKNSQTGPDKASSYAFSGLPPVTLALATLKGNKLDEVVRAATEAGVERIVLLNTERTIPKESNKLDRLRRISAEALSQSGSKVATMVEGSLSLDAFLDTYPSLDKKRLGLYLHEQALAQSSLHQYCSLMPEEYGIVVGPEGGLSARELYRLDNAAYKALWLGSGVLRAETAAIFVIASLRIVFLERNEWSMKK